MMDQPYRTRYRNTMTEADLGVNLKAYADWGGWLSYHTHDSRHSQPGFPDWVLVREGQIVFCELKSASGRLRPMQKVWLKALEVLADHAPGVIRVKLWRPDDIDEMRMFLRPLGVTASGRPD